MPHDLTDMADEAFDDWMYELTENAAESRLRDETLVMLLSETLREGTPEARARGLVDLANLCYAMADKTLGSFVSSDHCLKIVVTLAQRH